MKPPAAIIPVLFLALATACGGNSTVSIGPPQGSGAPSSSSGPANQSKNDASPGNDTTRVDLSGCDPNYEPCVPVATDVDCGGKGGNGPAYVRGPIKVIGKDIYQLDRDGNGIGCE